MITIDININKNWISNNFKNKMYLNTNVMDVDSSDKVKKVFQENPSLSQQQNRVYYKKYINEIN